TIPARAASPLEPTIGDILRYNLAEAIKAQQQATAAKTEFNATMQAARERFFTTDPKSLQHKKAEEEFATLLRDKDILFGIYDICNGARTGLMMMGGAGVLTGGGGRMPDNGIPKPALTAYTNWVNAVRSSLGAKNETQLLAPSEEALRSALVQNEDVY